MAIENYVRWSSLPWWRPVPVCELAGFDGFAPPTARQTLVDDLSVWLAVPKKKVTRSKKRMKTTAQKRIVLKDNIVVDRRTGEITLRHKLPANWRDYIPTFDYDNDDDQPMQAQDNATLFGDDNDNQNENSLEADNDDDNTEEAESSVNKRDPTS